MNKIKQKLLPVAKNLSRDLQCNVSTEPELLQWFKLRGLDVDLLQHCEIVVSQAILNDFVKSIYPDASFFDTPLDVVADNTKIPRDYVYNILMDSIHDACKGEKRDLDIFGKLYISLIPQKFRRIPGQFWTHGDIADFMVKLVMQKRSHELVDIGCGSGVFLLHASNFIQDSDHKIKLRGIEVNPLLLNLAIANFLYHDFELPDLENKDFILSNTKPLISAICNPPYTRHHHISPELKDSFLLKMKRTFQVPISRLSSMPLYFMLKTINDLSDNGCATFIVPMEVFDAGYGKTLREVLCKHTTIEVLLNFSEEMNAFNGVDVSASILLFRKEPPDENYVKHVRVDNFCDPEELLNDVEDAKVDKKYKWGELKIRAQSELVGVNKWTFLVSQKKNRHKFAYLDSNNIVPLKNIALIMRGIATGANDFFLLTNNEVKLLGLEDYIVPTIQKNREIQDIYLDKDHWDSMLHSGKKVWLLYITNDSLKFGKSVRDYLKKGEAMEIPTRSLVKTRKKWYFMEKREKPPIIFTYLSRANPRFILNEADALPLNVFLLIYPNREIVAKNYVDVLWAILNSDFVLTNLREVGRTYGGNTIKIEPRELDELPVINPLNMPGITIKSIKEAINDFKMERNSDRFLTAVNDILYHMPLVPSDAPFQRKNRKQLFLYDWVTE